MAAESEGECDSDTYYSSEETFYACSEECNEKLFASASYSSPDISNLPMTDPSAMFKSCNDSSSSSDCRNPSPMPSNLLFKSSSLMEILKTGLVSALNGRKHGDFGQKCAENMPEIDHTLQPENRGPSHNLKIEDSKVTVEYPRINLNKVSGPGVHIVKTVRPVNAGVNIKVNDTVLESRSKEEISRSGRREFSLSGISLPPQKSFTSVAFGRITAENDHTRTPVNVSAATVLDVNGNPIVGGRVISQGASSSPLPLSSSTSSLSSSFNNLKVISSRSSDEDDDMGEVKNSIMMTLQNDVSLNMKTSQLGCSRSDRISADAIKSQRKAQPEEYEIKEDSQWDGNSEKRAVDGKGKIGNGKSTTSSRRKKSWSKHCNSKMNSLGDDWSSNHLDKSLDSGSFNENLNSESSKSQNNSGVSATKNEGSFTVVPVRSKKGKGSKRQHGQNGKDRPACSSKPLSFTPELNSECNSGFHADSPSERSDANLGKLATGSYRFLEDLQSSEELLESYSDISVCGSSIDDWVSSTGAQSLSTNYSSLNSEYSFETEDSSLFNVSAFKYSNPLPSMPSSSVTCHSSLPGSLNISVSSALGILPVRALASNSCGRGQNRTRKSKIFLDTRIDDNTNNKECHDISFGFDDGDSQSSTSYTTNNRNNSCSSLNNKNSNSNQRDCILSSVNNNTDSNKVSNKSNGTKKDTSKTLGSADINLAKRTSSKFATISGSDPYSTSTLITEPYTSQDYIASRQGCSYLSPISSQCSSECSVEHDLTFTVSSELQQYCSTDKYNISPYHNNDTSIIDSFGSNIQYPCIYQTDCDSVAFSTDYSSNLASTYDSTSNIASTYSSSSNCASGNSLLSTNSSSSSTSQSTSYTQSSSLSISGSSSVFQSSATVFCTSTATVSVPCSLTNPNSNSDSQSLMGSTRKEAYRGVSQHVPGVLTHSNKSSVGINKTKTDQIFSDNTRVDLSQTNRSLMGVYKTKTDQRTSEHIREDLSRTNIKSPVTWAKQRDLSAPVSEPLKKTLKSGRGCRGKRSGFNLWEAQTYLYQAFSGVKQELGMR